MKNKIDGVFLLNKPLGLSSNTALQKVKRIYKAQKAGHTGTLDPLATGLLPICFGEATKFAKYLLESNKEYIATIKLGEATTTYDSEGEIIFSGKVNVTINEIRQALLKFTGEINQIPPIYSALKVNGKALYEYARNNEEVIINSRPIHIYVNELLEFVAPNIIKIKVRCSKGTYIRTLAHDIGVYLGCGAHLVGLVRTKTNNFDLDNSTNLDDLSTMSEAMHITLVLPVDILVQHLSRIDLTTDEFKYVKNGHKFYSKATNLGQIRLYYDDHFLGIANLINNYICPVRLIVTN
ncbi:MAG: tRNA pseudouridine(55) synthase TruB [Burkholderiales bacterium]|nr:tRNA pseudouridine(55) synthase TruB [Burkholderiales bacterium]